MRKKQTKAELEASGSWRAKHRNDAPDPAPITSAASAVRPEWLRNRETDVDTIYEGLLAELTPLRSLSGPDLPALMALAHAWSEFHVADAIVQRDGLTLLGAKGGEYTHPVLNIRSSGWKKIVTLSKQFGLTPASRAAVEVVNPPKPSPRGIFADEQMGL